MHALKQLQAEVEAKRSRLLAELGKLQPVQGSAGLILAAHNLCFDFKQLAAAELYEWFTSERARGKGAIKGIEWGNGGSVAGLRLLTGGAR